MKKYIILSLLLVPFLASASFDKDLYYGLQKDAQVQELQEFLTEQSLYSGPITGNFYSLTQKAVKTFQTNNSISSTGYVGPLTRTKLNSLLSPVTNESNAVVSPAITPPKTNDDVVATLTQQIAILMSQIQELQKQQTTLQNIQTNQETQTQKLSVIQQNTTPVVVPVPTPAPTPTPEPTPIPTPAPVTPQPVVKELIVSADKTSVPLSGWHSVTINAEYTENGSGKTASYSFTAPDKSQTGSQTFIYKPKTLGAHTISVTSNGITKSVNVEVVPYVIVDPKVEDFKIIALPYGSDYGPEVMRGNYANDLPRLATFKLSDADEPFYVYKMIYETDIPNPAYFLVNYGSSIYLNGNARTGWLSTNRRDLDQYYTVSFQRIDLNSGDYYTYVGNHSLTIKGVEIAGQNSNSHRVVTFASPIVIPFTIK